MKIITCIAIATSLHFALANAQDGRIFFSGNRGQSWKRIDKGLPPKAVINNLAFTNGVFLAATEADGVLISTDSLNSWHTSNNGLPANAKIDAIAGYENNIIIGSNKYGIFISTDTGRSWHLSNEGLTSMTVRCLFVFGNSILAGTNGGIYISLDKGRTWRHSFAHVQINGITALKGKLYAGLINDVAMSADEGKNWVSVFTTYTPHNISNNGEYVYAMCYGPKVVRSKDDGSHWTASETGLPALYTFQIESVGSRLLACQWDGMYKSDDYGDSWSKSSEGLPVGIAFKELLVTGSGVVVIAR